MSKIIEALEKSRKSGGVESMVAAVGERDTLGPAREVGSPAADPGRHSRPRKAFRVAMDVRALDPATLRGVDPLVEVLHHPLSGVSERYRALRSGIERSNTQNHISSIAVTSALKGEGKSVTATNLAAVLAQDSSKDVLLVDADLRAAKVQKLLGLPDGPGLANYLQGDALEAGSIRSTDFFGLSVVTAGNLQGHPSELLASQRFAEFVNDVCADFDYAIFDCPPVFPISDVSFLSESIDGILMVVRAHKTPKRILERVAEGFPKGKLLGTVLNQADVDTAYYGGKKRGYKYYYGGYS